MEEVIQAYLLGLLIDKSSLCKYGENYKTTH